MPKFSLTQKNFRKTEREREIISFVFCKEKLNKGFFGFFSICSFNCDGTPKKLKKIHFNHVGVTKIYRDVFFVQKYVF